MKVTGLLTLFVMLFWSTAWADECLDCRRIVSPGIVADWQASNHEATVSRNGG